jgi:hypothetical protein
VQSPQGASGTPAANPYGSYVSASPASQGPGYPEPGHSRGPSDHPSYPDIAAASRGPSSHPSYPDIAAASRGPSDHPSYPDIAAASRGPSSHPSYPDIAAASRGPADYPGYPDAPRAAGGGSWQSAPAFETGSRAAPAAADGYLPAAGPGAPRRPTGRHAQNPPAARGYGEIDYGSLRYDDPVYPDTDAAGPAAYAGPGAPTRQYQRPGYDGRDGGYDQDGYQGYPATVPSDPDRPVGRRSRA